jgi:multiple antibiotic resistance protein
MSFGFSLYAFVTLLAMLNPVEAAAAFATLTPDQSIAGKRAIALRASIIAGVILLGFGLIGAFLFEALGITFAAFRIAGGLLLLKVAVNMVFAQETDTAQAEDSKTSPHPSGDPAVFPLAIPIITGPGALTAIVTLFGKTHGDPMIYLLISAIALVVMLLVYFAMVGSDAITRVLGTTGVDATGRLTGIIVAAIAVQLVIDGVYEVFKNPPAM